MKIFDNIMSWKKPEMLDLAKELNIKGRSKMNKGEVAESISKILLSDEYFKTVLAALDKEQTECLVNLCESNEIKQSDVFKIRLLLELGYISFENEQYSLCDEVKYLVAKCYTNESKGGLEVRDKIINYCNVFAELYEIVPLDKVFEIYDKQNHDISKEDFMELINTVNGKMDLWEIYNNSIVNTYVLEEGFYDDLLKTQGNKPLYIPSRKKIMKMANPGYIEETNEYLALRHYLIKRMGMDEVKGENLCFEIEMECKMSNENAPDILSLFDKYNVELNDNNAKKVIGLVQAVNLNTRKAVNRGYTDLQIEEINNRYMVQNDFFPFFM